MQERPPLAATMIAGIMHRPLPVTMAEVTMAEVTMAEVTMAEVTMAEVIGVDMIVGTGRCDLMLFALCVLYECYCAGNLR